MCKRKTYRGKPTKYQKDVDRRVRQAIVTMLMAIMFVTSSVIAEANSFTIEPQPEAIVAVADDVPLSITEVTPIAPVAPVTPEVKEVKPNVPIVGNAEMIEIITSNANEFGVNADIMIRIAKCESGFNPLAKNSKSTATGIFQFTKGTWEDGVKWRGLTWSLSDRLDPRKSADMAAWFMAREGFGRWACFTDNLI